MGRFTAAHELASRLRNQLQLSKCCNQRVGLVKRHVTKGAPTARDDARRPRCCAGKDGAPAKRAMRARPGPPWPSLPPDEGRGTVRGEIFAGVCVFEGFKDRQTDTMPTVEGGVCAAVLLVRLAHPNLGFTAVSGWAIS